MQDVGLVALTKGSLQYTDTIVSVCRYFGVLALISYGYGLQYTDTIVSVCRMVRCGGTYYRWGLHPPPVDSLRSQYTVYQQGYTAWTLDTAIPGDYTSPYLKSGMKHIFQNHEIPDYIWFCFTVLFILK